MNNKKVTTKNMEAMIRVSHCDLIPECPSCKKEIDIPNSIVPVIDHNFDGAEFTCKSCHMEFEVTAVRSYLTVEKRRAKCAG